MNLYPLLTLFIAVPMLGFDSFEDEINSSHEKALQKISAQTKYLPQSSQRFIATQIKSAESSPLESFSLKNYCSLTRQINQTFALPYLLVAIKSLQNEEKVQLLQENSWFFQNPTIKQDKKTLTLLFRLLNSIPETNNPADDPRAKFLHNFLTRNENQETKPEELVEQQNCIDALSELTSPILRALVRTLAENNIQNINLSLESPHNRQKNQSPSKELQKLENQLLGFISTQPTIQEKTTFLKKLVAVNSPEIHDLCSRFGALNNGPLSEDFFSELCKTLEELDEESATEAIESFMYTWVKQHDHINKNLALFLQTLEKASISNSLRKAALCKILPLLLTLKADIKIGEPLFGNILKLTTKSEQQEVLACASLKVANSKINSPEFTQTYAELCSSYELFENEQNEA